MTETSADTSTATELRPLASIAPKEIFAELQRGVLGQDAALRYVAVAIFKHVTGKVPGNILLIGNSGTGKTTIMNNIQRLYQTLPEYRPFRAMTIINANLLVDSDRMEFRPDRLLTAAEQRARSILGRDATAEDLKAAMERATVCIDEIDKMSAVVAGKPNAIGVVLQQGLLTLMEGETVAYKTYAVVDGEEREVTLDVDTGGMMFICGGAFEGLYDQVYLRVAKPGSGEKLKSHAIRTADGDVRIEERFTLGDFLKDEDLFTYGMVPQFLARFDNIVLLDELSVDVLKEILLKAFDSPYQRSRRYFEVLNIDLEVEDLAAALIAEQAQKHTRTGARALRTIFGTIVNRLEYDPWRSDALEELEEGKYRLVITADLVRRKLAL